MSTIAQQADMLFWTAKAHAEDVLIKRLDGNLDSQILYDIEVQAADIANKARFLYLQQDSKPRRGTFVMTPYGMGYVERAIDYQDPTGEKGNSMYMEVRIDGDLYILLRSDCQLIYSVRQRKVCAPDKHVWKEVYYGDECEICGLFVPDGCGSWNSLDIHGC